MNARGINQTGVRPLTRRPTIQPYSDVRPSLPVFTWDMDPTYNSHLTTQDMIAWIRQFGSVTINITSTTEARELELLRLVKEYTGGPWGPPRLLIIGAPYHRAPWASSHDPSDPDTNFASRDFDLGKIRNTLKRAVAQGIQPHNVHIYYDCEVFYDSGPSYDQQQMADRLDKYYEMYHGVKAISPLSPVTWYAAGWRRFTGNGSNNANLINPSGVYPIMEAPTPYTDALNYVWYRPKYPEAEQKCFEATRENLRPGQKVSILAWIGSYYEYSNASGSAVSGYYTSGYKPEWASALGHFCKQRQNDLQSLVLYPGIHQGEGLSTRHPDELPARLALHRALTTN